MGSWLCKNDDMSRAKAFTLIELLVVIAIIAILAAILFPVFAQAKTSAKKTQSISNVKQVALASLMYVGDNDDVNEPLYYYDAKNLTRPTTQGFYYWPVLDLAYTKSENIYLCPMDTLDDSVLKDSKGRGRFDPKNELHDYILGANPSYGLNYRYLNTRIDGLDPNGTNPTPFYYVGKSLSTLESPASTVKYAEATMKDKARPEGGGTITSAIGYSRIEAPSFWKAVAFPNATGQGQLWGRFDSKSVIVAWLDGHVKYTPISKLKGTGTTADTLDVMFNGVGQ